MFMSHCQIDFSPITGSVGYRSAVLWEKNNPQNFHPSGEISLSPMDTHDGLYQSKDTNWYHVSSYDVIFELVLPFWRHK